MIAKQPIGLSKSLSVYLDLVRLLASLAVVIFHGRSLLMPGMMHFIGNHGKEAVMVFFVLSGFVIAFVVSNKEHSSRAYTLARLSRIYSVVLVAIVFSLALDAVGLLINGDYYRGLISDGFFEEISIATVVKYLTFTNQLWFSHVQLGSLGPYWSLGYEVPYYLFFGLIVFLPGKYKVAAGLLWFLVAGPKVSLYLSIWMLGVGAYYAMPYFRERIGRAAAIGIFALTVLVYPFVNHYLGFLATAPMQDHQGFASEATSYLYALIVAMIVVFNILAFDAAFSGLNLWNRKIEAIIRWAAGATFTIYLVHQPVQMFIHALFPSIIQSRLLGAFGILVSILIAVALAEISERRKRAYSNVIQKLFFPSAKPKVAESRSS